MILAITTNVKNMQIGSRSFVTYFCAQYLLEYLDLVHNLLLLQIVAMHYKSKDTKIFMPSKHPF